MQALVTKTHLDAYKHIADSVRNVATWPQYVVEAQMFDVKHWLGDALLNELLEQAAGSPEAITPANETLLAGGSYVYNAKTYIFGGLRACIVYYAFARFISRSPYNFTAAGITVKDSDFSTPASDKAIQRMATEAMLAATSLRDEVKVFLSRNPTTYPLYEPGNTTSRPRTFHVLGD
jgi:hypothetical protein